MVGDSGAKSIRFIYFFSLVKWMRKRNKNDIFFSFSFDSIHFAGNIDESSFAWSWEKITNINIKKSKRMPSLMADPNNKQDSAKQQPIEDKFHKESKWISEQQKKMIWWRSCEPREKLNSIHVKNDDEFIKKKNTYQNVNLRRRRKSNVGIKKHATNAKNKNNHLTIEKSKSCSNAKHWLQRQTNMNFRIFVWKTSIFVNCFNICGWFLFYYFRNCEIFRWENSSLGAFRQACICVDRCGSKIVQMRQHNYRSYLVIGRVDCKCDTKQK